MTTYKIALKSETTGEIVATLRGSETKDQNMAYENAIRYNQDLRADHCHYVVVDLPDKPTGTFLCLACGQVWDGSRLYQDPARTLLTWTCGNLFCGGTVEPIQEGDANVR